ncbi:MAG: P-II family nitrogen regulator [Clostridia bacterium]|nr:P-II family nitrogen regulator [Clostridia bacterium]
MSDYEVVMCIVNAGYSDVVMDAAREVGARGGTVIHARGTANKEAEEFFHITIQPDKDIVMILVPAEIKDAVLHALYQNAGLKTEGQGIAFSMPVDHVVGISGSGAKPEESKETDKPEEAAEEAQPSTPADGEKTESEGK